MPRPIPVPLRQAIMRGFRKGDCVAALASRFNVAQRTVRHLVRRLRDADTLAPQYERCGRPATRPSAMIEEALRLRQQHDRWGAGLIRAVLQDQHPDLDVPCTRTMQRWLRRLREEPAPAGRRPASESQRARQPHGCWQMDAAEQKRLKSGQLISWLRVADECSGAVLKTVVFPPRELESGAGGTNPKDSAGFVCPLGSPAKDARRQRLPVGFLE